MNRLLFFLLIAGFPLFLQAQKINYKKVRKCQDLSVPELNVQIPKGQKVLLVFPHADDEIVVAGLASHFVAAGAEVHLLTLGSGSRPAQAQARMDEVTCSSKKLGMAQLDLAGLPGNKWENVMKDEIEFWYDHKDSIRRVIRRKVEAFQPDVLITYDTELGGYGHPEHRISAQLTEEIFFSYSGDEGYAPQMIFQSTLPDDLESFYLKGSPPYLLAQKLTGHPGLPQPNVALEVGPYWEKKNTAAACHRTQYRTLKKFYLLIDPEHLNEHAAAFHREYYEWVTRE